MKAIVILFDGEFQNEITENAAMTAIAGTIYDTTTVTTAENIRVNILGDKETCQALVAQVTNKSKTTHDSIKEAIERVCRSLKITLGDNTNVSDQVLAEKIILLNVVSENIKNSDLAKIVQYGNLKQYSQFLRELGFSNLRGVVLDLNPKFKWYAQS